ncbi:Oidioi.mRNA.OKI2018_I69.XSR.g14128.t1.cds [Oikopleura dioica]|uniref:Oidioi.mRNA.OKI2018_I69.XSR.g14128.t1.cds n=1 Tax=Oikopleura dioica TaxID=34765 RepID=A0ABN7S9F2_OIKDI|nr:Oidioi.mRNA.OKI2018_I69.XSR.g14128.t1.cds [Oikopleura dioica]
MPKIKPNSEADEYTKKMTEFLKENPYPSDAQLKDISERMGKSKMQIYMWFANNRRKHGINKKNNEHYEEMNELFVKNPYPSDSQMKKIAEKLGKSEEQIQTWFANNRHKHGIRKESKTDEYTEKMNELFKKNPYPSASEVKKISKKMGKSEKQIYSWFSNNRQKHGIRKSKIEKDEFNEKMTELLMKNPYPSASEMKKIAKTVNKSQKQIYIWFVNNRHKHCIHKKTISNKKLLNAWRKNKHPSPRLCKQLASEIGRSERYVSYWFWKKRREGMNNPSETTDEEEEFTVGIKKELLTPEKKVRGLRKESSENSSEEDDLKRERKPPLKEPELETQNVSSGKNDDWTSAQNLGGVAKSSDDLADVEEENIAHGRSGTVENSFRHESTTSYSKYYFFTKI